MAERTQGILRKACDAAIPKKRWHIRSIPWWTAELTRAKRNIYRTRRRYQGAKNPATREQEKQRYRQIRQENGDEGQDPKLAGLYNRGREQRTLGDSLQKSDGELQERGDCIHTENTTGGQCQLLVHSKGDAVGPHFRRPRGSGHTGASRD
jgi:hypothetical protein